MSTPTPYWQTDDGRFTLYCGDCMEVLPGLGDRAVDITVSSPPYNMIAKRVLDGRFAGDRMKSADSYDTHTDDMDDAEYAEWMRAVFGECVRASLGLVWINHKTKYANKAGIHPVRIFPWPIYSEVIWARPGSIQLNARRYAPSHEFIYGFGVPHYWDRMHDMNCSVWQITPERNVPDHPCPFPVVIPRRLIESSCPDEGIVLDPFTGSGTTGVACARLGRRFIGRELSPAYCDVAIRRIQNELAQPGIFDAAK